MLKEVKDIKRSRRKKMQNFIMMSDIYDEFVSQIYNKKQEVLMENFKEIESKPGYTAFKAEITARKLVITTNSNKFNQKTITSDLLIAALQKEKKLYEDNKFQYEKLQPELKEVVKGFFSEKEFMMFFEYKINMMPKTISVMCDLIRTYEKEKSDVNKNAIIYKFSDITTRFEKLENFVNIFLKFYFKKVLRLKKRLKQIENKIFYQDDASNEKDFINSLLINLCFDFIDIFIFNHEKEKKTVVDDKELYNFYSNVVGIIKKLDELVQEFYREYQSDLSCESKLLLEYQRRLKKVKFNRKKSLQFENKKVFQYIANIKKRFVIFYSKMLKKNLGKKYQPFNYSKFRLWFEDLESAENWKFVKKVEKDFQKVYIDRVQSASKLNLEEMNLGDFLNHERNLEKRLEREEKKREKDNNSKKRLEILLGYRREIKQADAERKIDMIEGFIRNNHDHDTFYYCSELLKDLQKNFFYIDTPFLLLKKIRKVMDVLLDNCENNEEKVILPVLKCLHKITQISFYHQKEYSIVNDMRKDGIFELLSTFKEKFNSNYFIRNELRCIQENVKFVKDTSSLLIEMLSSIKLFDWSDILKLIVKKYSQITEKTSFINLNTWYSTYFVYVLKETQGLLDLTEVKLKVKNDFVHNTPIKFFLIEKLKDECLRLLQMHFELRSFYKKMVKNHEKEDSGFDMYQYFFTVPNLVPSEHFDFFSIEEFEFRNLEKDKLREKDTILKKEEKPKEEKVDPKSTVSAKPAGSPQVKPGGQKVEKQITSEEIVIEEKENDEEKVIVEDESQRVDYLSEKFQCLSKYEFVDIVSKKKGVKKNKVYPMQESKTTFQLNLIRHENLSKRIEFCLLENLVTLLKFRKNWNSLQNFVAKSKEEILKFQSIHCVSDIISFSSQKFTNWDVLKKKLAIKKFEESSLYEFIESKAVGLKNKYFTFEKMIQDIICHISFLELDIPLTEKPLLQFAKYSTESGKVVLSKDQMEIEGLFKQFKLNECFLFTAKGGSGKSCLFRFFAWHFLKSTKFYPIFLKADSLADKCKDWKAGSIEAKIKMIEETLINSHYSELNSVFTNTQLIELKFELKEILKNEKLALIIDGFDEVPDVTKNKFTEFLKQLLKEEELDFAKIFLSSRPIKEIEDKRNIIYSFTRFEICPLSKENSRKLVENILTYGDFEKTIILKRFEKTRNKIESDSPLISVLILKLLLNTEEKDDEEIQNKYHLYSKILFSSIEEDQKRKKAKVKDEDSVVFCSTTWIMNCFSIIAYILHRSQNQKKNNLINILNRRLEQLVDNEKWLLGVRNPLESIIDSLVSFSSLCSNQKEFLIFSHRTIQEFFSARFIINPQKNENLSKMFDSFNSNEHLFFSFYFGEKIEKEGKENEWKNVYDFINYNFSLMKTLETISVTKRFAQILIKRVFYFQNRHPIMYYTSNTMSFLKNHLFPGSKAEKYPDFVDKYKKLIMSTEGLTEEKVLDLFREIMGMYTYEKNYEILRRISKILVGFEKMVITFTKFPKFFSLSNAVEQIKKWVLTFSNIKECETTFHYLDRMEGNFESVDENYLSSVEKRTLYKKVLQFLYFDILKIVDKDFTGEFEKVIKEMCNFISKEYVKKDFTELYQQYLYFSNFDFKRVSDFFKNELKILIIFDSNYGKMSTHEKLIGRYRIYHYSRKCIELGNNLGYYLVENNSISKSVEYPKNFGKFIFKSSFSKEEIIVKEQKVEGGEKTEIASQQPQQAKVPQTPSTSTQVQQQNQKLEGEKGEKKEEKKIIRITKVKKNFVGDVNLIAKINKDGKISEFLKTGELVKIIFGVKNETFYCFRDKIVVIDKELKFKCEIPLIDKNSKIYKISGQHAYLSNEKEFNRLIVLTEFVEKEKEFSPTLDAVGRRIVVGFVKVKEKLFHVQASPRYEYGNVIVDNMKFFYGKFLLYVHDMNGKITSAYILRKNFTTFFQVYSFYVHFDVVKDFHPVLKSKQSDSEYVVIEDISSNFVLVEFQAVEGNCKSNSKIIFHWGKSSHYSDIQFVLDEKSNLLVKYFSNKRLTTFIKRIEISSHYDIPQDDKDVFHILFDFKNLGLANHPLSKFAYSWMKTMIRNKLVLTKVEKGTNCVNIPVKENFQSDLFGDLVEAKDSRKAKITSHIFQAGDSFYSFDEDVNLRVRRPNTYVDLLKIKEYHPNGRVKYFGEAFLGTYVRTGYGYIYDEFGTLMFEGNFLDGERHGEGFEYIGGKKKSFTYFLGYKRFNENKDKKTCKVYDGKHLVYDLENVVHSQYLYFTAKGKRYHPNGKVEVDGLFKNSLKHGLCKVYDENGVLKVSSYYSENLEGSTTSYYENGKLSFYGGVSYGTTTSYVGGRTLYYHRDRPNVVKTSYGYTNGKYLVCKFNKMGEKIAEGPYSFLAGVGYSIKGRGKIFDPRKKTEKECDIIAGKLHYKYDSFYDIINKAKFDDRLCVVTNNTLINYSQWPGNVFRKDGSLLIGGTVIPNTTGFISGSTYMPNNMLRLSGSFNRIKDFYNGYIYKGTKTNNTYTHYGKFFWGGKLLENVNGFYECYWPDDDKLLRYKFKREDASYKSENIFGYVITGKGTEYYRDQKVKYEGLFEKGVYAEGKYYNEKGVLLYEGKFGIGEVDESEYPFHKVWCTPNPTHHKDTVFYDGAGTLYFVEGVDAGKVRFVGEFKNGSFFKGVESFYEAGKLKFEGLFEDGKYIRKGKLYDTATKEMIYEGEVCYGISGKLYGTYSGVGKVYVKGVVVYDGEFRNGIKHGKGKIYKEGKLEFDGEFHNGLVQKVEGKKLKIFYENNTVKYIFEKYKVEEGKYTGTVMYFNTNGHLHYQGEMSKELMNGKGTLYHTTGTAIGKNLKLYVGSFLNNYKQGKGKEWDIKGELTFEGDYVSNYRQGKDCKMYENGKLKYEGQFSYNYIYIGKEFDLKTGKVMYDGTFSSGKYTKGKLYKNGKLVYDGQFYNFTTGDIVGVVYHYQGKLYDEKTGKVIFEGQFDKGRRHGSSKVKGQEHIEYYYGQSLDVINKGKGNETRIVYFDGGKTKKKLEFRDCTVSYGNIVSDKVSQYRINGSKFFEGKISGEVKGGNGKLFYPSGEVFFEGVFYNNMFQNGKLFYKSGKLFYTGAFDYTYGRRTGMGKSYWENGNLKYEGNLSYGKMYSTAAKTYHENGKIKYEGGFSYGNYTKGKLFYDDESKGLNGLRYEGNFVDGKMESGKLYEEDGSETEVKSEFPPLISPMFDCTYINDNTVMTHPSCSAKNFLTTVSTYSYTGKDKTNVDIVFKMKDDNEFILSNFSLYAYESSSYCPKNVICFVSKEDPVPNLSDFSIYDDCKDEKTFDSLYKSDTKLKEKGVFAFWFDVGHTGESKFYFEKKFETGVEGKYVHLRLVRGHSTYYAMYIKSIGLFGYVKKEKPQIIQTYDKIPSSLGYRVYTYVPKKLSLRLDAEGKETFDYDLEI